MAVTLSIVIPAWNEEACIGRTLEELISKTSGRDGVEIVVSVSGDDGTAAIASGYPGVTVCLSGKGRALQMNNGAAAASGRILYFLHADTVPPPSFCDDILEAVRNGSSAGCFRMRFDDPDWLMQAYGWFTQFPLTVCRGGDQSLFITRELFDEIGGFNDAMPVMEDIDIIERIQKKSRFTILEQCVTTSSRKYREHGRIELQALFGTMHLMYALGYPPEAIAQFYRRSLS